MNKCVTLPFATIESDEGLLKALQEAGLIYQEIVEEEQVQEEVEEKGAGKASKKKKKAKKSASKKKTGLGELMKVVEKLRNEYKNLIES